MVFGIEETTINEIHRAFESGDLTSEELVDEYLERIEVYDRSGPKLNSIRTINDNASDRAAELDQTLSESGGFVGPLHGIPVVVKDHLETTDMPTTYGSEAFEGYYPESESEVTQRLREAGAIILAKTNMPDWATSWFGFSSIAGRTKNPYNLNHDPGGSSSGTGAAVAANLGAVGIGSDCGGSIRVPSSFDNLVGFRVTPGLISRSGVSPLVSQQDTAGPMTRTVRDTAKLLDVLVGYDNRDDLSGKSELAAVRGSYTNSLNEDGLQGARIGVLRDGFGENDAAEQVNDVVELALTTISNLGATLVDPVEIPDLNDYLNETMLYVLQSKSDLNEFLNERDTPVSSVEELYKNGQYHELLDLFIAFAEDAPSDLTDHLEYWKRRNAQHAFQEEILSVFANNNLDAIVFPDVQVPPPSEDEIRDGKYETMTFATNTIIASQSLCTAVSIPAGFTEYGLPVGIEFLGKPYDESSILKFGYAFEQATQHRTIPETTSS
ncbi:Asp-tRNAAsn/Glu-tRNAGln amidotransferase A subunit [Halogranum amylolyticum]|uniref:Asp-tRNAAsn/Glu-tRNAGln amidotransferase A subunit n=1 Tax=Halogranum amylolyticum TaxID=660520 RepID=A0A1H8V134_9EURY|nr:amidase [Halogranum amylolyticum]SEP08914.1 Asp-tRNAAsn/Glu-tRNAGln amidotransferase A subunit [Halogranum amylolyticum]